MAGFLRSMAGSTLLRVSALAAAVLAAPAAGAEDSAAIATRQNESRAEYERVLREISLSSERTEKLAAEIAAVKKDHATITAALVQAAKTEKKLGQDIEDITERLEGLKDQREGIRRSLEARRGVLAEVLGALQRMGLNPPPALLVRPEDALSSVRSAILLGAVVPELRSQTESLLADLNELTRVTTSIETERQQLAATVVEQLGEKRRLGLLLAEKSRLQGESETALVGEREKSAALAAEAGSLKDLIASLESDIVGARSAEEKARRAEEERAQREAALAAMPVPESNQLAETAPFSRMQGKLAVPVAGRFARRFGQDDSNGGVMLGDMVATQSDAIVTAPSDGSVLYAGPFRSYGQLLILNAGDGYHVVLAGMARISVATGQSVLAGEPVGAMGQARAASASVAGIGNAGPELYVEFRKDGKPVDPAPWWAVRFSGRTGNGA